MAGPVSPASPRSANSTAADVIARTKHGRLMLYKGDGRGTLTSIRTLYGSFIDTRFAV
jgi:hypothetical protein